MVATVLAREGGPTMVIGAGSTPWLERQAGRGFPGGRGGRERRVVPEASPTIAVVTTIDAEHLDYYRDLSHIRETFLEFINKVPFYGLAVLCLDQENIQALLPRVRSGS